MKKALLLLSFSFTIAFFCYSQNREISGKSIIKEVVVYNSSAEVYHTCQVDIPAGQSTIVFKDLTKHIIDNTINIRCLDEGIDIITVTERINFTAERIEQNRQVVNFKDSIDSINKKLGLIYCKIEALMAEKDLLFKGESIGGVSQGVPVAEIEKAASFFRKRFLEILIEIHTLTENKDLLETKRRMFQNQISEKTVNTVEPTSEIHVTILSSTAKKANFEFKYLTNKAGWAPAYDFRFQGENSPIDFVFRANVYNATGVNWNNVKIKLSTANPTIDFKVPEIAHNKKPSSNKQEFYKDGIKHIEIAVMNPIEEYDVSHNYSFPSDGKPYLIDVQNFAMPSEFFYLLIPRLDPFGFLMAKIPNWNTYNLIPGNANIYNRGSFMGKTFLDTYTENDTLSLFLGKNNSIRSVRTEESAKNRSTFIGNHYIDKSNIRITISNNQTNSVSITVIDLVPYFDISSNIRFNLINPNNGVFNEEKGTITWQFNLGSQESRIINFGHEIRMPKTEAQRYNQVNARYRTISCPTF